MIPTPMMAIGRTVASENVLCACELTFCNVWFHAGFNPLHLLELLAVGTGVIEGNGAVVTITGAGAGAYGSLDVFLFASA